MAVSTLPKKDIVLKWVQTSIPSGDNHIQISAVPDSGYEFLGWVGCTTQGWVSSVMIEFLDVQTTTAWNINFETVGSDSSVRAYFLQKRI